VATAGLVAFLAVDVALVAMALRTGRDAPATPPVAATLTATSTTRTSSVPPTSTTPSTPMSIATTSAPGGKATQPTSGVPVQRLVSALDATTAWRASVGSCVAGGARLEVTTDGGASWTRLRSPARALVRVQPLSATSGFVIGAATGCELRQQATNDVGRTWQPPTAVSGAWARRLDEPTRVLTPKDPRATPCGAAVVVDLSRTSTTQAQVLCAGGAVVVSNDGGLTWADSGRAPGAVALGNRLAGGGTLSTYAVRVVAGCQGVQVVRVVKGQTAEAVACVPTGGVAPGQVGLSLTAAGGWLAAGDATWVSSRDLTSWKRA
jgi:hypothetical protein